MFALEFFKNGCNAKKAAESVGYSPKTAAQHGHTLLKDETVKHELKMLSELFSLDKLSSEDKTSLEGEIADINEVLITLTKILRRDMPEDEVVIIRSNKTEYDEDGGKTQTQSQTPTVVKTLTRVSDVNKAADTLMKYFAAAKPDGEEKEGGVVILAPVSE